MLPIRGAQMLLAVICLGLSAYESSVGVEDIFGDTFHGYSEANYNVFTSVWTILLLAYLITATIRPGLLFHKWATVAFDALTMLFWFAAFISIAAIEGAIDILFGTHAYQAAVALAVFGAFEWLLFVATTVLDVLNRGGQSSHSAAAPQMQGV